MIENLIDDYICFVLICAAIPLGIGALCGLGVGVLQAATQIQEQSISYLVKLGAVTAVLWFGWPFFLGRGLELLAQTLAVIALLGGGGDG